MTAKKRTLPPGHMGCAPMGTVNQMKETGPQAIKNSATYSPKPGRGLGPIKGAVNQPMNGYKE